MATDIRIDCNHLLRIAGDLKTSIGSSFGSTVYEVRIDLPIIPSLSPDYYDNRYYTKSQTYTKTEVNSLFSSHATDIIPWSQIDPNSTPDTLAGYGIIDSYTIQQANLAFVQNQSAIAQNATSWINGAFKTGSSTNYSSINGSFLYMQNGTGSDASIVMGEFSLNTPSNHFYISLGSTETDINSFKDIYLNADHVKVPSVPSAPTDIVRLVDLSSYTPISRELTINGTTYDLSSDRSWTITSGVSSVFGRTGAVTAISGDYSSFYYPLSGNPSGYLTSEIDPTVPSYAKSLSAFSVIQASTDLLYRPIGYVPAFSDITSKPTTLSGYGITDAVPSSRTITINGTTFDLSANRSWTVGAGSGTVTSVTSSNSDISVTNTTTTPILTIDNINGITKSYYDPTSSIQTQLNSKQGNLTLTTTGTGASTLVSNTLNIPTPVLQQVFQQHTAPTGTLHDGDLWYVTP